MASSFFSSSLLFLISLSVLINVSYQEDCTSRNYEEPCQALNGDIQDGDGLLPQKHIKKEKRVTKRALISNNDFLWPDGIIYYTIDTLFTDFERRTILEAMIDWENNTCIRFKEGTNSTGYVHIRWSHLGCCSYIGRVGCRQGLSLHRSCFNKGTVSHELGHVMGMYHEQNRPDRDDHVIVVTQNIKPDAIHNFNRLLPSVIDSLDIPYDYNSIMHYSPFAFARITSLYTMVSRTPNITIGPGQCPSRLDFIQINKLYKCESRNVSSSTIQLRPSPSFPPSITLPYPSCGRVYTSSFNFTHQYTYNTYCQWAIAIPHGYNLTLLLDMNIESSAGCIKDYVRVQDTDGNWGQRYCSFNRRTHQETSGGGVVMINYRTDSYNSYNGGFTGLTVKAIISDIDECSSGLDQCSHNCHNINGSYGCSCPNGMYLSCDNRNCFDINECVENNGGCKHKCTNLGRGYNCSCSSDTSVECCLDGYTFFDNKCLVKGVDECQDSSLNECSQFCTDDPLSYQCSCKRGYDLSNNDMSTCIDINECNSYVKPEHHCSSCINYESDFLCLCEEGYTYGPDLHTCEVELNECIAGTHNCTHNCINTEGSYTCTCPNGWTLSSDEKTCTDINECTDSNSHDCQYICINTEGSYTCSCPNGFTLNANNRTCKDINECIAGTHNCTHNCINTEGSYSCTCPNGWTLSSDEKTCTDINECTDSNSHDCQYICINTEGSYTCSCPNGFTLNANNRTCKDINECSSGLHNCTHTCNNTEGSYICTCPNDWSLSTDDKTCLPLTVSPSLLIIERNSNSGIIQLNSSNSTWKIRTPDVNKAIKLTFLSQTLSCGINGSSIEVYNGYEPLQSILLFKGCTTLGEPLVSSINELSINYTTGNVNDKATLQYETINSANNVKACVVLLDYGQRFSLSSFPNKYTQSMECSFYVIAPRRPITVTILYTDLNYESCSTTNRLSVHNSFDLSKDIGAMCNPHGQTVFVINSLFTLIRYVGMTTSKYRGFEAIVTY